MLPSLASSVPSDNRASVCKDTRKGRPPTLDDFWAARGSKSAIAAAMASLEFPAPARAVNEPIAASAPPAPNHPLAARLKPDAGRTAKLQEVRAVYGSGLAMRLAGEDARASEVARLPGLESSHVLRDTIRGDAESLGFEDVLNLPSEAAEAPKASLHDRAERLYGIGGGGPEII